VLSPAALLDEVTRGEARAQLGRGAAKGRTRLLITRADGEMLQLDLADDTGLLHRYEGRDPTPGARGSVVVELEGWRRVDGCWLPGRRTTRHGDDVTEDLELQAQRVNTPPPPRSFHAPWGIGGALTREL
jgi:hypothetical protein